MSFRKFTAGAAVIAALGLATIDQPSAHASPTTGCVSVAEYGTAHAGMSRARIENIFGTTGKRVGQVATDERRVMWKRYRACGSQADVKVTYWGPLCQCTPFVGPYQMHKKTRVS